jgi:Domain of unknown function (DUF4189)
LKFAALIGLILLASAVRMSSAATQAECVQRCSSCGNSSTCDAIYAQCMSNCMRGSQAQPAPQPDVWGAVALSPSTMLEGHSWNFKSENEANQRAMKECQAVAKAGDCKVVLTVADVCMSLAVSKPDKIYAVSGPSPGVTFSGGNSKAKCQRAGGKSCEVAISFCADGIRHEVRDGRVLHR